MWMSMEMIICSMLRGVWSSWRCRGGIDGYLVYDLMSVGLEHQEYEICFFEVAYISLISLRRWMLMV